MDGNFKADHIRMPVSKKETWLIDGEGFFVADGPYQKHLKLAKETRPVRPIAAPARHTIDLDDSSLKAV